MWLIVPDICDQAEYSGAATFQVLRFMLLVRYPKVGDHSLVATLHG